MKKFSVKKVLALFAAMMLLACCLAACGEAEPNPESSTTGQSETPAADSDKAYVVNNCKLVVGITDFAPMDYQDENGNWIGFDADVATAFANSLGCDVEFQVIEWENKVMELDSKAIDVVWNGMTLSDEVLSAMECSNAYCNNAQIVIVPAADADKYKTVDDVKGLSFAVEAGSAGKAQAAAIGAEYTEVVDQATALAEVKAGTAEAAIIDSLMAAAMVGEGTGYADLAYTVQLNEEKYGVGFRKGSDLAAELNQFFKDYYAEGTMELVAEQYGVQASLIPQE